MEREVFPLPEIEARLKRFVRAQLWINDRDPAARSAEWSAMLERRFGTSAIPLYAAMTPDGRVLGSIAFRGGLRPSESFAPEFGAWLDRMLAASKGR